MVDQIGESSVTYRFRVLSGEKLHAEGKRVHVRLDPATLRPTTWAPETKALYESLSRRG